MSFELCACEYPMPVSDLLTEMHCQYKARPQPRMFRVMHKRVDSKCRIYLLQNRILPATSAEEALSLALERAGVAHLSMRIDTAHLATAERQLCDGAPRNVWTAELA